MTTIVMPAVFAIVLLPLQGDRVTLREMALRTVAADKPRPAYPAASLAKKTAGVAVASLSIGTDGRVEAVDILEAPDADIAAAVTTAAKRWTVPWRVGPNGEPPRPREGKLTFYFRIVNGAGRVFNPEELPGGPPRPAPPPSASSPPPPPLPAPPGQASREPTKAITIAELRDLFVLDIGSREAFKRGHRPGAVNIPVDELNVRGGIELPKTVAIDCTRDERWRCEAAAATLRQRGITTVVVIP